MDDGSTAQAAATAQGVAATPATVKGSSPYATGGGGVDLARRVAAIYLGCLLTGGRRAEAGDLPVVRVSFQNDAEHPVDDLLVACSDGSAEATLAVACRATPNFVPSDAQTVALVGSLLSEADKFPDASHCVAVAVDGWKNQWDSLATLTVLARASADLAAFEAALAVKGRWAKAVTDRWGYFEQMVAAASGETSGSDACRAAAFGLLSRLHLLGFHVQGSDERDRATLATTLDAVAGDGVDGLRVRDRLETQAASYDSTGAVVDLNLLRRDLHDVLSLGVGRTKAAWDALAAHRAEAVAAVRTGVGDETATGGALVVEFADRRATLADAMRSAGTSASALVVSGESGTGKSALVLATVEELEAANPGDVEAVVLNFRALPPTSLEFRTHVGLSVDNFLRELAAPCRLLVIDAADASVEGSSALLTDLVTTASSAGVGLVVVTSSALADVVNEQVKRGFAERAKFTMDVLGDDDVAAVADRFPLLRKVLQNLPAASLLRRLVVLDLLARAGVDVEGGLSDWACLELVWIRVVRGDGQPGTGGSPEAREHTLLAVAEATLNVPVEQRLYRLDPASVDVLRRSHLLLPPSVLRADAQFAHDEVRRYATAILLLRSGDSPALLRSAGIPRWAMSAATLACKGLLVASGASAPAVFVKALSAFADLAADHGSRWADVPIEAVFETAHAYECLTAALTGEPPAVALDAVVRVVTQRYSRDGLISPSVVSPVIRILLDHDEPWNVSKESFRLLASWLQTLVLAQVPAGEDLRMALRARVLAYWDEFPEVEEVVDDDLLYPVTGAGAKKRRRLDYHLKDEEFVETMALLGPDIDEKVEECLRSLAAHAPAFLAPAADSPLSARAIAARDPELLADLIEAYYIDTTRHSWHTGDSVRRHQGRWTFVGVPFCDWWFGGFWALFNAAPVTTSVRVLNNILNHAAAERVRTLGSLGFHDEPEDDREPEADGALLNLDGTPRKYVGDSHAWSWYRGTTVGPYSAMSALLAMERVAERWLAADAPPSRVVEVLLEGCSNLAVPGMLFGLLVRHAEKSGPELDRFLAEPIVWRLEFARATHEHVGFAARTEDLVNIDRRKWAPHQVAMWLALTSEGERVDALEKVGELLIANGHAVGIDEDTTRKWALAFDRSNYKVLNKDDQVVVEVALPEDLQVAQQEFETSQAHSQTILRLQNRYWGAPKYDSDTLPPTATETAADLMVARALLETAGAGEPFNPFDAAAHVVRRAVALAVSGEPDALGSESDFVAQMLIEVASSFADNQSQREEGQYFDQAADRSVALALPALLTTNLRGLLDAAGYSSVDVIQGAMAMAANASAETRLYLARGTDIVWSQPCAGEPCMHESAVGWLLETARGAELGPWDNELQHMTRPWIEGDVLDRLRALDSEAVSLSILAPAIRGLGPAAAATHCMTEVAQEALATLLDVQRRAMVAHEKQNWTADHRGEHTLVAARALLNGYAAHSDVAPVLAHLDVLREDDGLLSGFLHGLAGAGAETETRANAARAIWPTVFEHALGYATDGGPNPFHGHRWGAWVASALLPDPVAWTAGIYNELSGAAIDWVIAEDLVGLFDRWLLVAAGNRMCVDSLIRLVRKLPLSEQVSKGLPWVAAVCVQDGKATVPWATWLNSWLKDIRDAAEEGGSLAAWQALVDALVVAGNDELAPYSQ